MNKLYYLLFIGLVATACNDTNFNSQEESMKKAKSEDLNRDQTSQSAVVDPVSSDDIPNSVLPDSSQPDNKESNNPPRIVSDPVLKIKLKHVNENFSDNELFISSSNTFEIRVYNATTLAFIRSFTHDVLTKYKSNKKYWYGPGGTAFNQRGNLVVSGYDDFIEFDSNTGNVYKVYPKQTPEMSENIVFDKKGNLYTTTYTNGSDRLIQYHASDYSFKQEIAVPEGAGELTGLTFDGHGVLYVGSQKDNKVYAFSTDENFSSFILKKSYSIPYPNVRIESIQFNLNGDLLIAKNGILTYSLEEEKELKATPWPLTAPLKINNEGVIYAAQWGDLYGTSSSKIARVDIDGKTTVVSDTGLYGPLGIALSHTILPGDSGVLYNYDVEAIDSDEADELTYLLEKAPEGMTINSKNGMISFKVTSGHTGEHDVKVVVKDTAGGQDVQEFTLTVTP